MQPYQSASSSQTPAPFRASSVDSFDVDDQAASLEGWTQSYTQLSAGAFHGQTVQARLTEGLTYLCETTNRKLLQRSCPPPATHTFALLLHAAGEVRMGGQAFSRDSIFSTPGDLELAIQVPENTKLAALQVADSDLVALAEVYDAHPNALRAPRASSTALTPMLRAFFEQVHAVCLETPQMLSHEQTRRSLKSAALSNLMFVLSGPHTQTSDPQVSDARRNRLVQRAREYIDEHLDEVSTVADVCLALGVSRRHLQYSFEDVLQINPIAYIRAMRLNAVRRDLKLASPGLATVADLASRWGFWHLGHFSGDYKRMFGELPSATLRQ